MPWRLANLQIANSEDKSGRALELHEQRHANSGIRQYQYRRQRPLSNRFIDTGVTASLVDMTVTPPQLVNRPAQMKDTEADLPGREACPSCPMAGCGSPEPCASSNSTETTSVRHRCNLSIRVSHAESSSAGSWNFASRAELSSTSFSFDSD